MKSSVGDNAPKLYLVHNNVISLRILGGNRLLI